MTADEVGKLLNVSRETMCQFEAYLALLEKWQRRINLVAIALWLTLGSVTFWIHSLSGFIRQTQKILDVGSGGGFPGWCWRSWKCSGRSCGVGSAQSNFSIHSYPLTWAAGKVHNQRIESLSSLTPDVITHAHWHQYLS